MPSLDEIHALADRALASLKAPVHDSGCIGREHRERWPNSLSGLDNSCSRGVNEHEHREQGGRPRPPRGLTMRDSRQMYRVPAGRDGHPTDAARRVMEAARAEHVVLVADNADLVIVVPVPRGSATSILRRAVSEAANVIATLHLESDKRIAAQFSGPEAA